MHIINISTNGQSKGVINISLRLEKNYLEITLKMNQVLHVSIDTFTPALTQQLFYSY
jgi:hypothetical protein